MCSMLLPRASPKRGAIKKKGIYNPRPHPNASPTPGWCLVWWTPYPGIIGRYRSTECPHQRQFQPLVQRFSQDSSYVPFLVGVLHYRMYTVAISMYSGGSNLYLT